MTSDLPESLELTLAPPAAAAACTSALAGAAPPVLTLSCGEAGPLAAPLAALRDLFFVPCAALAVARHAPRPIDLCLGFGPWGALTGLLLRSLGRVRRVVYQDRDYEPGLLDDRFRRKWNYYLAYCEAAFALRNISVLQTVHTRPNNLTFR